MKQKRLSSFFIKKFILFSLVLVTTFSIFMNVMLMVNRNSEVLDILSAKKLIPIDYETTDTSLLENLDGWIEILDENNHVIFTKGVVGEVRQTYTQAELLEQSAFDPSQQKHSITIAGIIEISSIKETDRPLYVATYHPFIGVDGHSYTGIVKVPTERLNISYTLVNASGELGNLVSKNIIILLLGIAGILIVCIYYYSRNIQKHLARPNTELVEGLQAITTGDYDRRLNFEAEYEYKEIQNSFNDLTEQLKQARYQREQYEKERQQLFSNMAHDLKTPITSIQGYASALKDGLVTTSKQQNYYETIYEKTKQMTELINRLLNYSKLEQAEYQLSFKSIDFCEFLRRIIVERLDDIEKNNQEIEIHIPNHVIHLNIDSLEMERVIINLINNAIKHNPPQTLITISLSETPQQLILTISDNGTPIPKSLQQQLFQPFVCGDESRTTKNGSGLGLSICQKIITKHNGQLQFRQLNDHEKQFTIIIPK